MICSIEYTMLFCRSDFEEHSFGVFDKGLNALEEEDCVFAVQETMVIGQG